MKKGGIELTMPPLK